MNRVCPGCGSGESLYSVETAAIMYPIWVVDDAVEYTGNSYIVLDENTMFSDDLYCRECDRELTLADLVEES